MIFLSLPSSATQKERHMRAFGIMYGDPTRDDTLLNSIPRQIEALGRLLEAIDAIRKDMRDPAV